MCVCAYVAYIYKYTDLACAIDAGARPVQVRRIILQLWGVRTSDGVDEALIPISPLCQRQKFTLGLAKVEVLDVPFFAAGG
jgi:hypothetical protein